MTCRVCPLAWLPLAAVAAATCAAAQGPSTPQGPPTTPADPGVLIRFHNGSVLQPATILEPVEIETKFGKVVVPPAEIRKIDFGFRLSEEDAKKLDKAMGDLSSEKFALRDAATKTLMSMGRLAYPAVLAASKGADLETGKRLEIVLKDIRNRVAADRLQIRKSDIIKTSDSSVSGQIVGSALRVKCDLFGEVKIPLSHLRDMQTLLPGGIVNLALDANKYGNKANWLMTDFDVSQGHRLEILVTGEINLDPGGMLGNFNLTRNIRPDGTPQLQSGEGYLPGQVVGKIGSDGPTFLVGSRHSQVAQREGKLYLRCVTIEHANNIRADGSYQVKISSEPN
jgi:hypothetical protein